ncbi:MAG: mechanosensitive ion channel [Burkholderiaceae bacterium]
MKRRLAIGILLFALGTQIAWSAGPALPQLLRAAGQQEEHTVDTIPDPAQLRADWWLYFKVDRDKLAERVKAAQDLLVRRYAGDPDGLPAAEIQEKVQRIVGQLDAFVAASALRAPQVSAAPPLAQRYTPAEALELVSALRKTRLELELENSEVAGTQAALESTLQQVDRAMAAYLPSEPGTPQRLLAGFDIMSERTLAAVTAEQLRVRRSLLEQRQAQMRELSEVERFAEEHLRGDEVELARLDQQLVSLQPALMGAQQQVLSATRRTLEPTGAEPADQFAARYRQQRLVLAEVELAGLEMSRLNLQAQRALVDILTEPAPDLAKARTAIDKVREKTADLRAEAGDWRVASERERERAGERAAENRDANQVDAAALINQDRVRLAQQTLSGLRVLDEAFLRSSYLVRWTNQAIHERQGFIARALGLLDESAADARDFVGTITDRSLFKLGETPITLSGIGRLLLFVLFAWLTSWVLRRMLTNIARRFPKENMGLMFVISRLAHYMIMAIGFIAGLSSIGLNLTNFALVAGALALGLGFGLQSIVNNFLSGLILFFERSIKVGDFVQLDNGQRGEVRAINVRGTVVNTNDNVDVVVPNSEFIERKVINWTLLDPFRRIHVPFRVAYESDEDKVVEAGLDAASRLSSTLTGVLGREPSVWLVNYGENGLEFELIVWLMPDAVKRPDAVFAAYHWEIRKALRRHGIEVPVPQREIRFRGDIPPLGPR